MPSGIPTVFIFSCSLHFKADELSRGAVKYEHLFSEVNKQKEAIVLLSKLIEAREKIENDNPPGANLDPSTGVSGLCCGNGDFTSSVLPLLSYGK